jgi:hypothetical protein
MPSFLTSQQAATLLGRTSRMAERRAKGAAEQGDPEVIKIGHSWDALTPDGRIQGALIQS